MVHALEALASVMSSDFANGLAKEAIKLIFEYLPTAYKDGKNEKARAEMAYAATMAGMRMTYNSHTHSGGSAPDQKM